MLGLVKRRRKCGNVTVERLITFNYRTVAATRAANGQFKFVLQITQPEQRGIEH